MGNQFYLFAFSIIYDKSRCTLCVHKCLKLTYQKGFKFDRWQTNNQYGNSPKYHIRPNILPLHIQFGVHRGRKTYDKLDRNNTISYFVNRLSSICIENDNLKWWWWWCNSFSNAVVLRQLITFTDNIKSATSWSYLDDGVFTLIFFYIPKSWTILTTHTLTQQNYWNHSHFIQTAFASLI